jgi:sRNA-binding protein
MYQRALAAGGPRFDLDGNAAGEVTPEQMAGARSLIAHLEAKAISAAKTARAAHASRRLAQQAAPAERAQPTPPEPRRLSLADLKRAAAERKQQALGLIGGQQCHEPNDAPTATSDNKGGLPQRDGSPSEMAIPANHPEGSR